MAGPILTSGMQLPGGATRRRRAPAPAAAPGPALTGAGDDDVQWVASLTVAEVLDAIDEGIISTADAVAAERAGKQRKTILDLAD